MQYSVNALNSTVYVEPNTNINNLIFLPAIVPGTENNVVTACSFSVLASCFYSINNKSKYSLDLFRSY
jgi:hypothetical protein